jgi:capsular exopolysaccharide synthesis family protein
MGYIFDAMKRADRDRTGGSGSIGATAGPIERSAQASPAAPVEAGSSARLDDIEPARENVQADTGFAQTIIETAEPAAEGNLRFADFANRADDRFIALTDPSSPLAEEYRSIRTRLLASARNRKLIHTITSASRAEGKTLTSLNLAAVFGEMAERRTIVVEGDLRVPNFKNMIRPEGSTSPGLIQVLRGEVELSEAIQPLHSPNLSVIFAGGHAAEGALQLLGTRRLAEVLTSLRNRYDHVIIDTPPVLDVADAGVIGALSDHVLLMLRISRTSRQTCHKAIEQLRAYNAAVTGVVLTDVRAHAMSYGRKYGYRYSYGRAAA